ncbi:DUF461 domain-containing protein [Streptomyces sp. NPDC000410]|uniref:DUF461 domain-containing protein n=1 Tax=Streptomyces sp. NPDC000410 TaxID=3154254 RepID=UPI00331F1C33
MSSSLRRGVIAATALVISIASLSACAAGNDAQTLGIKPDNAATSVGDIKIQNAAVLAKPGAGPAAVSATVFNNSTKPQTLESITLPDTEATVKLTSAKGSGPVTVPALGSVILGGEGNASAVIAEGVKLTDAGDFQPVVFKFSETGDVRIEALVAPSAGYFKDFGPTGAPEAPATTPTGTPTGGASSPATGAHGGENEDADADADKSETETETESTPSGSSSASHEAGH